MDRRKLLYAVVGAAIVVAIFVLVFARVRRRRAAPARRPPGDQCLIVRLRLSDGDFGSEKDLALARELSSAIDEAVTGAGAGKYDGDGFGGGWCELFLYGPDADALLAIVSPLVRASPLGRGATAYLRYGRADDAAAREVEVEL